MSTELDRIAAYLHFARRDDGLPLELLSMLERAVDHAGRLEEALWHVVRWTEANPSGPTAEPRVIALRALAPEA